MQKESARLFRDRSLAASCQVTLSLIDAGLLRHQYPDRLA